MGLKQTALSMSALLLTAALASCANSLEALPSPSSPAETSASALLAEPPLTEEDLARPVPTFLSPEQQTLYRRADSLYTHLLGDSIEYAETFPAGSFPPEEYETVTIEGCTYLIAQGRYANYDDFEAAGLSIFTEEFWQQCNVSDSGLPLRTESNGKLCFLDTSMGIGYYYCEDVPDAFRLEEQTDREIRFTLIGHYRNLGGETSGPGKYDYTLAFPMRLTLTDNGWRFAEFHSALIEEREPEP